MSDDGLIAKTATELVGLLRTGEVSSHELLDALERRITVSSRGANQKKEAPVTRNLPVGLF